MAINSKVSYETRLAQIGEGIEQGKTVEQIAAEMGIAMSTMRIYSAKVSKAPLRRLKLIQKALPEVDTLEELGERTGMKPQLLRRYARRHHLTLPKATLHHGWRPEIDVLIAAGKTLTEIANDAKISFQAVSRYINQSSQDYFWKER